MIPTTEPPPHLHRSIQGQYARRRRRLHSDLWWTRRREVGNKFTIRREAGFLTPTGPVGGFQKIQLCQKCGLRNSFWRGEHLVDKNLPRLRFHFHNEHKPKSLDDTDLVAVVPTRPETPLKLLNWNLLSNTLGSGKVIVGPASIRYFHRDDFSQDQFPTCTTMQRALWLRHKHTKKREPGAELRTDCCVYVKGCFHRWRFIWNPLPP